MAEMTGVIDWLRNVRAILHKGAIPRYSRSFPFSTVSYPKVSIDSRCFFLDHLSLGRDVLQVRDLAGRAGMERDTTEDQGLKACVGLQPLTLILSRLMEGF